MPSWKISSSVVNRPWTRGLSFLHWEDCGVWREGIESVQCLPVHVSFGGKIIISVLFLLIYIVCWLLLRFFCIISKGKRDPCTNTWISAHLCHIFPVGALSKSLANRVMKLLHNTHFMTHRVQLSGKRHVNDLKINILWYWKTCYGGFPRLGSLPWKISKHKIVGRPNHSILHWKVLLPSIDRKR